MNVYDLEARLGLNSSEYDKGLSSAKTAAVAFSKDFTKIIGSVLDAPNNIGKAISNIGNSISGLGSALESRITKPAAAAGAALAGITLAKGWSRMTQIDTAKAKLRALGNTAEDVSGIMDSALTSVKGTAYGMDEAATTAASAVAAGIKNGEDLTRYLTSVGDTAAIAGTSMADMGAIFNKVTTAGKAQNDVLSQLAERGIPIYQWLADETGHAADEVFELAKDGEINLETFRRAVETHVGGAAKELGNATLTGAIANVWAAVSRVGANFLGAADDANSFAGQLLPVIIKAQDALGKFEDKAKEWGKVFGEVFSAVIDYIEKGQADLSKMSDTTQKIWSRIEPILNTARSAIEYIMKLPPELTTALGVLAVSIGPLLKYGGALINIIGLAISNGPLLIAGISALVAALVYFNATGKDTAGVADFILQGINKLAEKIPEVASVILNALPGVANAIASMVPTFLSTGTSIITNIIDGIITALPTLVAAASTVITSIGQSIMDNGPKLIGAVIALWSNLYESIGQLLPTLIPIAVQVVTTLAQAIFDNAPQMIAGATALMDGLKQGIIAALPILIEALPGLLSSIADAIMQYFWIIKAAEVQLMAAIDQALIENFPMLLDAFVQLMEMLAQVIINNKPLVISSINTILNAMLGVVASFAQLWIQEAMIAGKGFLDGVIYYFTQLPSQMAYWVGVAIGQVITYFATLPGRVATFLTATMAKVQEFVTMIRTKGPEAARLFMTGLVTTISTLPGRMSQIGWDIVKGLWQGISNGWSWLMKQVGGLVDSLVQGVKDGMKISSPSKVFADEVGKWIPAGIAVGVKDNTKTLTDTIDDLVHIPSLDINTNVAGGSKPGSVVINVYGAEGQSEERLAEIIQNKMLHELNMQRAVSYA